VAQAFAAVAREQGARILLNQPVQRLEVAQGRVVAMHTQGKRYPCDQVIATADYHFVETQLLPPASQAYPERYWQSRQLSPSALLVVAGVRRKLPRLAHHTLFFDTNWDKHFQQVFDRSAAPAWSAEPLFYLCVPSRTDPSVAPKGMENLFLVAPMAPGVRPTPQQQQATAQKLLERVAAAAGESFAEAIVTQRVFGPEYFSTTFNAYQGNAFGLAHTLRQSTVLRPRLQSKRVKNLFYAGQYTNPGTGVPMVIQSGKLAAGLAARA
jgi:phytoene desaturase